MKTFYVYSVNTEGSIAYVKYGIKAKSRLDAIKQSNVEKVYWEGARPYGVEYIGSKFKVYAKLQG
jgi:hypothetical protein